MLANADSEVLALRALAHPLRLRLLELAAETGSITTTTASARTGESSANCSFHLRLLAKHGFLDRLDGRDRRERPWRPAARPPLADLLSRLASVPREDAGRAELMRRQLRIFDPDKLLAA
jgi:DNA-binding transcriptional ArsR family regulator